MICAVKWLFLCEMFDILLLQDVLPNGISGKISKFACIWSQPKYRSNPPMSKVTDSFIHPVSKYYWERPTPGHKRIFSNNAHTFLLHKVELVRRRTPVLLQVYLTTGLFVIVSWISFIVPPEVVPGTNKTFWNGPRIVQSSCYIFLGVWGFVWATAFVLMRFMWSITRDYENL